MVNDHITPITSQERVAPIFFKPKFAQVVVKQWAKKPEALPLDINKP